MGVKWTPEQESAIMSPKDSNLGLKHCLSPPLLVLVNGSSCRAYYYAFERYGRILYPYKN